MTWRRWNFLLWPFIPAIAYILLQHIFATAWSNRCDPGNAHYLLMQDDPVADFRAPGELFTLRNPYPDNGWMCSSPSLSLNHVGPNVNAMFDATRNDMTSSGWSEEGMVPAEDFAVYYKTIDGTRIEANVWKRGFWVEVDLNGPSSDHFGEMGFGS